MFTPRDLGSVAFKLMGIVLCIMALLSLPVGIASFWAAGGSGGGGYGLVVWVWVARFLLHIALGAGLIVSGEELARRLLPSEPRAEHALAADELLAVLLAAVGVFMVARSVPLLVQRAAAVFVVGTHTGYPMESTLLVELVSVVMGLVLFVGARKVSETWRRLRSFD